MNIIIHQTYYERSDWSRAFNQFTIACELDMINARSAADIAFITSSSTSACVVYYLAKQAVPRLLNTKHLPCCMIKDKKLAMSFLMRVL